MAKNKIKIRDLRNGDWFWINKHILVDSRLGKSDKLVYSALASFTNEKQSAFPSMATISKRSHCRRPTVVKSIKLLEKLKYIKVDRKIGQTNTYNLLKPVKSFNQLNHLTRPVKSFNQPVKKRHGGVLKRSPTNNTNITIYNNKTNKQKKRDPQDFYLAQLLYKLIKQENPDWYVKPNWDKWTDDIRKLRKLDKRSSELIEGIIRWCRQDKFWKQNILSPAKLREKFNTLVVQAKSNVSKFVIIKT